MSTEVHVKANGDPIDHADEGCPCGPSLQPVERGDGSVGWVVVHHGLDGREKTEEGSA